MFFCCGVQHYRTVKGTIWPSSDVCVLPLCLYRATCVPLLINCENWALWLHRREKQNGAKHRPNLSLNLLHVSVQCAFLLGALLRSNLQHQDNQPPPPTHTHRVNKTHLMLEWLVCSHWIRAFTLHSNVPASLARPPVLTVFIVTWSTVNILLEDETYPNPKVWMESWKMFCFLCCNCRVWI